MTPPELVNLDSRYRRLRDLGSGGYGDVYLVHHEDLDKDMALKVMKEQFAEDERFVELFRREAKLAAKLSHPNVVAVNDAGEGIFEGRKVFYIVMEYVSGGTLRDRIKRRRGPLPPREAVELTLRVAEALEAAHQSGLIHRDIKPENILLTESGHLKVADFGLARAASAASSSGLRLATPRYISPEQAKGEPATFRSDLYSLGVVFYEMLTGKVPYDAESDWGILSQHIQGQLRPPKEVNPNVPEGINQVCVRLLAKDSNERYRDAAELIAVLKAMKDDPDAVADYIGPTVPLGRVRDDTVPTIAITRSWADRLAELYLQARRLHRAQEWQAVADVFEQIHVLDPEYPDPEGLLISAREALTAPKPNITESNVGRIQLLLTIEREEHKNWWGKLVLKKEGHTDSVNSVTFSPDGRLLASGSRDNTVRLWRVEDGALLRTFEGYSYSVVSMAFSPDWRLLALGGGDNTVRLWRVEDEALLHTLEGHTYFEGGANPVHSVAFSPDGQLLASSGGDNTVRLWRVEDGALLHTLETSVESIAFSPDGQLLASGSYDNTVRLWRVEDGTLLSTRRRERYNTTGSMAEEGHTGPVNSVAFSPDGQLLASSSTDNTVRLWRVEDGKLSPPHTLMNSFENWVYSVAFSPDGRLLAFSAGDGLGPMANTVQLWRVEGGPCLRMLEGHTDLLTSVVFSPDGRLLASASLDKTVRLWGIA